MSDEEIIENAEPSSESITVTSSEPEAQAPAPIVEDAPQDEPVADDAGELGPEDDGQSERVAESPADDYNLGSILEEDEALPYEYRTDPEVAGTLTEVGALAKEAGLKPEMAKMLVAAYAGIALTEKDRMPNIHDDDEVLRYMTHQYGSKEADAIVRGAQEATAHFGPKFSAWLDRTRLGSHPSMLLLLSAMAPKDGLFARNTSAQAREAMKKLRADKSQKWHTPGAKARWRLLTALGNMEEGSKPKSDLETLRADAKAKKPTPDSATAALDRQLAEFRRNPAYSDRSNPSHKEVFAQYMALMHRRWPGMHNAGGG